MAHMDTGSQFGSLNNVQTIGSTLSISETVGILREKAYATNDQPFNQTQAGMNPAIRHLLPGVHHQ